MAQGDAIVRLAEAMGAFAVEQKRTNELLTELLDLLDGDAEGDDGDSQDDAAGESDDPMAKVGKFIENIGKVRDFIPQKRVPT